MSLKDDMAVIGARARQAANALRTSDVRDVAIRAMADALRATSGTILSANARDMDAARARGLPVAMLDRLHLDAERLEGMAAGLETVADQDDPVGRVLESWTRPNGLRFDQVSVPIGVIGMIYESRPNVTADAAALCIKAGNAVILRGGTEAVNSNRAIAAAIAKGLRCAGLSDTAVQLVPTQDRAAVGEMLSGMNGAIDLLIPRGGKGLVSRVQRDARVPVLAHLDGLNTTYVHLSANLDMALSVVGNAKMRRTGVCGSTETVLVEDANMVGPLVKHLTALGCEVRGDEQIVALSKTVQASAEDFRTEHLAPIVNMALVADLPEAVAHIAEHGSGHTDAIIADDHDAAEAFLAAVDSAIVMHNASTQFADGGEFGFGAEIGIATGRVHARGPVGARHLVTTKYVVRGDGTIRP